MKLSTFSLAQNSGWTVPTLPDMDSNQTLVMAFGASSMINSPAPIAKVAAAFPNSSLIGCSTAGEIFGTSLLDDSLSVAVIKFERTELATTTTEIKTADDSFSTGQRLANALNRPDLRSVFVLSEGVHVNGSELVRGLNSVFPETVILTGGLAGDGDRFVQTWVIKDSKPQSGFVTAVGFYGKHIVVGHGSKGGWDAFGAEMRVTKSRANVLYELNGKPALRVYKEAMGDKAAGLPASGLLFPLAIHDNRLGLKTIVRTILGVDEATQSLTFAGDILQGSTVQMMKADFKRLIQGAYNAAIMTKAPLTPAAAEPILCVAISCIGRRLVLQDKSLEELKAVAEVLPPNTKQIGFYSYGEISPYTSGHCDLHNQTMTLTTFREEA